MRHLNIATVMLLVLATSMPPACLAVKKVQLSKNAAAYELSSGEDVKVDHFQAVPAGSKQVIVLCVGPADVYYHTEGNPPLKGSNDNGRVKVGQSAKFKLTSLFGTNPKVYLKAKWGNTRASIFQGDVYVKEVSVPISVALKATEEALKK
jgi:hypothetical protein